MYVVALVAKIGQACVFRCCGEMLRSRGQEEPKQKNKRVIVTTGADSLSTYARKHTHEIAQAENASRWGLWDCRSGSEVKS